MITKTDRRNRRKLKIRNRVIGTMERPRLSVYKTNQHIYAQLVDDSNSQTLMATSDVKLEKGTKSEKAKLVGESLAKLAQAKKITKVVFDRNGFKFHGRIKELAQGAKDGGLIF
ncbi:MAG TPA: 50S ribosomal protein L18 [Candidatus Dojkabacteria bacterium]|nr:50S ribosomal protein L18 [Candidatus Dojkabacteria bacterium]HRP36452.1 50S ribosomal protein L18 [Candidatus Dojkabacteria bacterium]HRP51419.1 50S ribosomal protein L18 [Candidatus Dojkabacteria bacterium]